MEGGKEGAYVGEVKDVVGLVKDDRIVGLGTHTRVKEAVLANPVGEVGVLLQRGQRKRHLGSAAEQERERKRRDRGNRARGGGGRRERERCSSQAPYRRNPTTSPKADFTVIVIIIIIILIIINNCDRFNEDGDQLFWI